MKKNIVITVGGTSEYIDKVRKITNSGTGKLGSMIAEQFSLRNDIDTIFYIHTPKAILPKINTNVNLKLIEVIDTNSVKNAVEKVLIENNISTFIHSMAISDYYVDYVSTVSLLTTELNNSENIEETLKNASNRLDNSSKLSSTEDNLIVVLKQTPKIINLIKKISPNTKLIGFKLLENVSNEYLFEIAKNLMKKNNCDYVVANDLKSIKNGNHKAFLLNNKNDTIIEMNGKKNIAKVITKNV